MKLAIAAAIAALCHGRFASCADTPADGRRSTRRRTRPVKFIAAHAVWNCAGTTCVGFHRA